MKHDFRIYHNPRCRKSREALQILQEAGIEPEIREYLKEPLSAEEIRTLAGLLDTPPEHFVRKGEDDYKEHVKGRDLSEQELVELMAQYPKLIERPIVVRDDGKAVLARPPEEVKSLL